MKTSTSDRPSTVENQVKASTTVTVHLTTAGPFRIIFYFIFSTHLCFLFNYSCGYQAFIIHLKVSTLAGPVNLLVKPGGIKQLDMTET